MRNSLMNAKYGHENNNRAQFNSQLSNGKKNNQSLNSTGGWNNPDFSTLKEPMSMFDVNDYEGSGEVDLTGARVQDKQHNHDLHD